MILLASAHTSAASSDNDDAASQAGILHLAAQKKSKRRRPRCPGCREPVDNHDFNPLSRLCQGREVLSSRVDSDRHIQQQHLSSARSTTPQRQSSHQKSSNETQDQSAAHPLTDLRNELARLEDEHATLHLDKRSLSDRLKSKNCVRPDHEQSHLLLHQPRLIIPVMTRTFKHGSHL